MNANGFLIHIVDDEEPIRKALSRLFLAAGFRVNTFASGDEFLKSLRSNFPDCLILDLHMPGLSGLDILHQLTQEGIRLPTVIITGHDEPGVRERALAAGAIDYLPKPLEGHELIQRVTEAANSYRADED
jgi:FixJ family two-component response regulator